MSESVNGRGKQSWDRDPLAREPGALCVSACGGVVRTWGLGVIDRPELVIRDCPPELVEDAKALLWDLAGWVVSTNCRLCAGELGALGEGALRLALCDEGLELWERDPQQGGYVPGLRRTLEQLAPLA
jgi:hypothetical protein